MTAALLLVFRCEWFLHTLSARAETRMSREKGEVRDLIKSDCFLIEIDDGTRLWVDVFVG